MFDRPVLSSERVEITKSRENQRIIVRIWSRLTIFQEEVVDHLPNVVLISVIRAATLQTLGVRLESEYLGRTF